MSEEVIVPTEGTEVTATPVTDNTPTEVVADVAVAAEIVDATETVAEVAEEIVTPIAEVVEEVVA